MRYFKKLNPEVIEKIKISLKKNTIRETGRKVGVSYYTAWCISQGKYDNDEPLQDLKTFQFDQCPILGMAKY